MLKRLLDVGLDQFFGSANDLVVPSEGGWRVFRSSKFFIPGGRIGCFGPGGNLAGDDVTHVSFFGRQATADFLVNALEGRPQPLSTLDPRRALPDRRLARGAIVDAAAVAAPAPVAAARGASRRGAPAAAAAPAPSLRVTVVNGDLSFEPNPLLIGHYASSTLTGTEAVMNRLVGWTMDYSLQRGLYPVAPGSHMVFLNRHVDAQGAALVPRPSAVIVAGLGAEGSLQAAELIRTVRLAVIGWARRFSEEPGAAKTFELASTLIGSGGTGITAGHAADLIIQGVLEANELIERERSDARSQDRLAALRAPALDRAVPRSRRRRVARAAVAADREAEHVRPHRRPWRPDRAVTRRPPDSGYRGAPYDFITVDTRKNEGGARTFEFTLDSRRARSEVRGKTAQGQAPRRTGGDGVERSEPRPADRPHVVQSPRAHRARGLPRRDERHSDGAGSRQRGHSVGAARPGAERGSQRGTVGDSREAAAQAQDRGVSPARHRRRQGRQRPRHRRAVVQRRLSQARGCPDGGHLRLGHAGEVRRPRAEAHSAGRRHTARGAAGRTRDRQRAVRERLANRAHRRTRHAG